MNNTERQLLNLAFFDEDEPRDKDGKWTAKPGGLGKTNITQKLFHGTDAYNVLKILQSKTFNLTNDFANTSENSHRVKGKNYYLSTSQRPNNRYVRNNNNFGYSMVVLDKDKLKQHHTVKPVDYWGKEWHKGSEQDFDEAEERLYHNKSKTPIRDSIKEIHVLIGESKWNKGEPRDWQRIRRILIEAKKQGIKVLLFNNSKDMLAGNKSKAVPVSEIKDKLAQHNPEKEYQSSGKDYSTAWRELVYKTNEKDLSKRAKDRLYALRYYNYNGDNKAALDADVHNAKKDPVISDKLMKAFKHLGVKSDGNLQDVVDKLAEKWKKKS